MNSLHRWINSVRHRLRLRAVPLPSTFRARIIEFLFFARLRAKKNKFGCIFGARALRARSARFARSARALRRFARSARALRAFLLQWNQKPHRTAPDNSNPTKKQGFLQGPVKKQGFWEETNSFRCLQRYGRSGFVYICTPHTTGPHNTGGGTRRFLDVELWRRLCQPCLIQIPHFTYLTYLT